ncbi:MAG TPA: hypothetical protein VJ798_01965 [Rhizomicrobium sp.]|nr:hypothetical protein [Rhizomicrobium sp.]
MQKTQHPGGKDALHQAPALPSNGPVGGLVPLPLFDGPPPYKPVSR